MSNRIPADSLELLIEYSRADCEFVDTAYGAKWAYPRFAAFNDVFHGFNLCVEHMMERTKAARRKRARMSALHRSYRQKKRSW